MSVLKEGCRFIIFRSQRQDLSIIFVNWSITAGPTNTKLSTIDYHALVVVEMGR